MKNIHPIVIVVITVIITLVSMYMVQLPMSKSSALSHLVVNEYQVHHNGDGTLYVVIKDNQIQSVTTKTYDALAELSEVYSVVIVSDDIWLGQ